MASTTAEYQYKEAMAEIIKEKNSILEKMERLKTTVLKVLNSEK